MATNKKTTSKKTDVTKSKRNHKLQTSNVKHQINNHIGLVRNDPWLEPFEGAISGRHDHAVWKINQLTRNGKKKLSDFASGHLYF